MSDSISETLEVLRERTDREDNLLNERTNIFLVCHSILMAGFALGSAAPQFVLLVLTVVGFVFSVFWFYVAYRTLMMVAYFGRLVRKQEKKLGNQEDKIYLNAWKWRKEPNNRPLLGFSVSNYISYGLPLLWCIAWLVTFLCQLVQFW